MNPRTRLSRSQSKSFVRQQRDRTIWKAGLFVIAVLAWVFVLSRLSWLGPLTIYNVQVYGADPDISIQLRDAALTQLDGSYLGLFARSDTFLYPSRDIAHAIMAASSRIRSVDVRRAGLHGLAVTVDEKAPAAVVCAELPDFTVDPSAEDPNCYYADDSGLIFQQALSVSDQVYRRYYEPDLADTASSSSVIGSYATSTPKFMELQSFYTGVHDGGIRPLGILMKDGGEYELYVQNPSASAGTTTDANTDIAVIYFNDAGSLPVELSNLIAFWQKETGGSRTSAQSPRYDSIDIRYGANIFYRSEK